MPQQASVTVDTPHIPPPSVGSRPFEARPDFAARLQRLLLWALLLVAILFVPTNRPTQGPPRQGNPTAQGIAVALGVCFLIAMGLPLLLQRRVLRLDDHGITYMPFYRRRQMIGWADVAQVRVERRYNQYGMETSAA